MMSRPLVTQTIPFTAGGIAFSGEAEKRLKKLASAIRKGGGDVLVVIEGHADAAGAQDFNDKLSQARAQAVADYLVKNGVRKNRLTVQGRGSSVPIASNDTPEGRGKNRRVEVRAYASLRQ
jgi:outer membrane protein OmpA-like peptidoglycan-associated protein